MERDVDMDVDVDNWEGIKDFQKLRKKLPSLLDDIENEERIGIRNIMKE